MNSTTMMYPAHNFHIPVMGIGFTIDTPAKAAPYGISSVVSLVDDILIEKLREHYCKEIDLPFEPIPTTEEDFRAKRITAYLNLLGHVVKVRFDAVVNSVFTNGNELKKYMQLLPDTASLKKVYKEKVKELNLLDQFEWLKKNLVCGSVDVNIMTKVDKANFVGDEQLPTEYNDAHAALRGYANSSLSSSLILSAGMSPRLYSYMENFADFFPDAVGRLKKKIVLKVSDYRSALIQGKFLAQKGLWVSEFRIESGLNCGGHAFATQGLLMGPILQEFKDNMQTLKQDLFAIYRKALAAKELFVFNEAPQLNVTAQGGVGTAAEHNFLLENYNVSSVGWGTPFLLVPEVVNVDDETRQRLIGAREEDLYTSDISPLGVPFNSLRGNTKDKEKEERINKGRPGSSCPKKYLALNNEFGEEAICTASREYQHLKIKELAAAELPAGEYEAEYQKVVEKSCICVGLGTSALLVNDMDTRREGKGVSICPGPNMAYFDKEVSLGQMVDHIYGRDNIMSRTDRPDLFTKELQLYVDFFRKKVHNTKMPASTKEMKYLEAFSSNLLSGITYYRELLPELHKSGVAAPKQQTLDEFEKEIRGIFLQLMAEINE